MSTRREIGPRGAFKQKKAWLKRKRLTDGVAAASPAAPPAAASKWLICPTIEA